MSTDLPATSELTMDHIQRALSADVDEPKTAQWIAGKLPKSMNVTAADVSAVIDATGSSAGIHRFELPRETKYWHASIEEFVRRKLIDKARSGPLSKAKICGDIARLATIKSQVSRRSVEQSFDRLLTEQMIQACPPVIGGRSKLFGMGKPDPAFYVRDVVAKLKKSLRLATDELLRALDEIRSEQAANLENPPQGAESPEESESPVTQQHVALDNPADERILIALRELEPRFDEGAIVSLRKLREKLELSFQNRESFDAAVLNLVSQQVLTIHPYDHPLTEADRQSFVRDERGTWYNVISKRI